MALKKNSSVSIDLRQAEKFLQLLGPKARRWTFQTFAEADIKDDQNASLARILHGSLEEHQLQLSKLNKAGAGIFVSVNRTDGKGRARENVKQVRALVLDLDGPPLDQVSDCELRPHIVVESSPGRFHAYWRVKGMHLEEFENAQRGLAAHFDGDPAVALLPAVFRLPGFLHRKAEPFRTRILTSRDDLPFPSAELVRAFPLRQRPHKALQSINGRVVLSINAPRDSAEAFLKNACMVQGVEAPAYCLHYYRGGWYLWSGAHFELLSLDGVKSKLYAFLDDAITNNEKKGYVPFDPNSSKVNQIVDAMKAAVWLKESQDAPFWIGEPVSDDEFIACKNGMLGIRERALRRHTPFYFNVNCVPFDYSPDAPPPRRWRAFLRELWPDDPAARKTLQEIFGLMLTADTRHQKIFMVVGPKRSGKGTIGRVLAALLGKENVVNPTLASLTSQFGLSALIDKRAAIISDARMSTQTDGSIVAERLLSISGEDAQTIDVKFRSHWSGRLPVRFLILTNELPRITDASQALPSRFLLLTLNQSFYGKEDLGLMEALNKELPGILNWALDGLDSLRERGHFEMPRSSQEALKALEDLASPVGAFVREWCVVGGTERMNVKEMYDAWSKWCQQHGHKAGSSAVFGRNLHAAHPGMRARGTGSKRFYQGIALSEEGERLYEEALSSS